MSVSPLPVPPASVTSSVRVGAAFCALVAASPALAVPPPPAEKTQYVIISFDGAHDLAQWERSRALAKKTGATFTYFLSCVFLLTPQTKATYKAPGKGAGRSNVGFAPSKEDVAARLDAIWTARAEGHDIASHGCGHFDGGKWSVRDWTAELDAFSRIVRDAWTLNEIEGEPAGWRDFAMSEIVGFRAPYLSTGDNLLAALADRGFSYDASGVSRGSADPDVSGTVARFALPQIPEGPKARRVIAMDYNLYVRHSRGVEQEDKDGIFEQRTLDAFRAAFDSEYRGGRVPLQIGYHFTLMNGGAYWRALESFAAEVCGKPDVACVSYRDYLKLRPPASESGQDNEAIRAGG